MGSGKTPGEDKKSELERQPDTKPDPNKDELAELIEQFSDEVEPIPPTGDTGQEPGEEK